MKEYTGKTHQRFLVWKAHQGICAYCRTPMMSSFECDHIIPQSLRSEAQSIIDRLSRDFEFPNDFSIDSYYNILPLHPECNNRKRAKLYPDKETIAFLRLAREKYSEIKKIESESTSFTRRSELDAILDFGISQGIWVIDDKFISTINQVSQIKIDYQKDNVTLEINGFIKGISISIGLIFLIQTLPLQDFCILSLVHAGESS